MKVRRHNAMAVFVGAGLLLAGGALVGDLAAAQGRGGAGGGASHRPANAGSPMSIGNRTRSQAGEHGPRRARASDRAREVAPPLGGTRPEQSQRGLDKAAGKASSRAKEVAPPLGGDPAKAGE